MRRSRSRPARAAVLLPALLALACAGSAVPARAGLLNLYGGDNVGTGGAAFMRIPVGARSVAMGQAYVANAIDGSAVFWNPAGMLRTTGRQNLFLSHVSYTAGIDLDYASVHWRGQNYGYGLIAGALRSGEIPRTTEMFQEGTGTTFRADQYFFGLALARAMTDHFSLGGTAKFYQENLDEFEIRSFLFDFGMLYYVDAADLRIGFAVRNFGSDLRPSGTPPSIPGFEPESNFQSFPPPTSGTFGVARTFMLGRGLDLLATADFNHPSDFSESFRFGSELGLNRVLFLRAGYETNRDAGGFATGFGVRLVRDSFDLRLDYALSDMGAFGTIHHISIDFSPLSHPARRTWE